MQQLSSLLSRRGFLARLGLSAIACYVPSAPVATFAEQNVAPSSAHKRRLEHPLPHPGAFDFLPLGSIRPRGWLLSQLKVQAAGLSGHLDKTWADVWPESGWLGGKGESWERGPYYLDGILPLAYLLDDAALKAKAQRFIDWTLDHQRTDGMIGPASNDDWWPRIVALKALTQYQEFTGDPRVIPVMDRYFRYQLASLPARPLRDWGKFRWQDEVLSVLWLYRRTGQAYLLRLADLLHQQGYPWTAQYSDFRYTFPVTADYLKSHDSQGLQDLGLATHGVNNGQAIKAGAVWSLLSGSAPDREASMKMIRTLEKYHGLPNGMFSCDEHLAGLNPSQGSELCTVVEYMYSLEQCLAITGEAEMGDRLERLAFNALDGAFTDDMWAHQYNQEPNQVECSLHHKPWTTDGPESNLFGLEPNFGCCTANYHQGWPKFASSLFLRSSSSEPNAPETLAAAVYAPCDVDTSINGIAVHLSEETNYPFEGRVRIAVSPAAALSFPLLLRIPGWAAGTRVAVNGRPTRDAAAGTFARIERTWKQGDIVEIEFPMQPRVSHWYNDSIAVERGPIVFSYPIDEDWVKLRKRGLTADWQVYPATNWNYALLIDPKNPAGSIKVKDEGVKEPLFTRSRTPVSLEVQAKVLPDWNVEDGVAAPPPQSPVHNGDEVHTIRLIPYAAAKLRITAFPYATS